jgi:hypothetical protein
MKFGTCGILAFRWSGQAPYPLTVTRDTDLSARRPGDLYDAARAGGAVPAGF